MDYYKEIENKKNGLLGQIGNHTYERYKLIKEIEVREQRIDEIDLAVTALEEGIYALTAAQNDFNAYLAIKENALTLGDIKAGVEAAGKENNNA